ncbi:ABC transporter ATP-binding protein [Marinobacter nitratireducens]|uniref:ABC transporter ATP-binding protein n=1 Tax=Marinobacter nitratireducens TaxID=1137280 RepID=UPI001D0D2955|nr:ABC transporter ATP-binding protein [Marinobacter nitratireducens]
MSVVAIGPFMALVGDPTLLEGEGIIADAYQLSGIAEPRQFLFWMGASVLALLALAAGISMLTIWRLSMYAALVGAELSSRLYRHYMSQPWLFHASGSSSQLTSQIAQECVRVTNSIINPFVQMNARVVMATLMMVTIFAFNPGVALVGVVVFSTVYFFMYRVVRKQLSRNGAIVSSSQRERYKLMGEGFGGVKDVLLLGRQKFFTDRFEGVSNRFARAQGNNLVMATLPKFIVELIAFGSVIFLILYLLASHEGNLGEVLPILSVYALAGFKLLPAFQQIYASVSQIRGNLAAFDGIRGDLYASAETARKRVPSEDAFGKPGHLAPSKLIELSEVSFTYPGKSEPALRNVTIPIGANTVVGLVGPSGSGKSTIIDVLLGLIEPEKGELRIDGTVINASNRRLWQNSVGFVPQSIFLADSSIRENIAFGLPLSAIDEEKVARAARMAHLDSLVAELHDGLDTRVGERGVQLSGGQRQRIGIARALYHDADVLVLDEATSALDGITERLIMDAIHDFSGKKTIIMIAHRLATVRKCDQIFVLGQGEVQDSGTYDELVEKSQLFKNMSLHS